MARFNSAIFDSSCFVSAERVITRSSFETGKAVFDTAVFDTDRFYSSMRSDP
jgi:hypothetical protein